MIKQLFVMAINLIAEKTCNCLTNPDQVRHTYCAFFLFDSFSDCDKCDKGILIMMGIETHETHTGATIINEL